MSKVFECKSEIDEEMGDYILKTGHAEEVYRLLECLKKYSIETYEHSLAVTHLSGDLGESLNYERKDVIRLKISGLLHDIGKITIPLSILHKKGVLLHKEKECMQTHADAGYRLLLPCINDVRVLLGVRQHHERLNGTGYPDKLSTGITEFAKIVMLADVYDGMTRKRVYRSEKISVANAKRIMEKEQSGYETSYLQMFLQNVV